MAGDDEGSEKKAEDLFEDLGNFFAPVHGTDWPAPEEEGAAPEPEPEPEPEKEAPPEPEPVPAPEAEAAPPEAGESPPTGEAAFLSESLTEDELPPIEGDLEREGASVVSGVEIEEYAYDESASELEGASTIFIEDEAVAGGTVVAEPPADVEDAAEHFASSYRPSGDIERDVLSDLEAPEEEPLTVKVGATEGLQGPSWQEPTSEEVGIEPAPSGPGRDLPAAFLTGIALAAVALVALAAGRFWFSIVAGIVLLGAQAEFYGVVARRHHQPATALGLVTGALILIGAYNYGEPAALAMFALGLVMTFVWYMSTPVQHRANVLMNVAITVFGTAWITLFGSALLVLLWAPSGRALVVSVLAMVVAYDATAFGVGSLWGDHPLAPTVSPRKSREGAIAATIVTIIIAVAFVSSIQGVDLPGSLVLGIVVAILAPLGDLAESLVKRDLGVKDMSSVLPGHGGVLDRIDALLFVAPGALIVLRMVLGA